VRELCGEYDLTRVVGAYWHDAETQEGEPVKIRTTKADYSDGSTGRLKIKCRYLKRAVEQDGKYGIVVYSGDDDKQHQHTVSGNNIVSTGLVPAEKIGEIVGDLGALEKVEIGWDKVITP